MRRLRAILLAALLLSACDRSDSQLKGEAEREAYLRERADSLHEGLLALLKSGYADSEGSVWEDTRLQLSEDWLVQSPEGYWGIDKESLNASLDCDPEMDTRCDPTFKRLSCEADSECSGIARCESMEATVTAPGQSPKNLCIGRADRLLNRVYRVMVAADEVLDLASLSLPTGRFRSAIVNALAFLSQKPSVPKIRLLFSGADASLPNFLHPPRKAVDELVKEVAAISPSVSRLQLNLAWLSSGNFSWNHAKIIVADGELALSGGHNLWDDDYLKDKPVFDLSMEYRGPAAAASRNFLNTLWSKVGSAYASYPKELGRIEDFHLSPTSSGDIQALAVGRLGNLGVNPSEDVLRGLLDLAHDSIFIDQQDLYKLIFSPLTKPIVFDQIVSAAFRGVHVQIVQSNKFPDFSGYGNVEGRDVYSALIGALSDRYQASTGLGREAARLKACEGIRMASFRFSSGIDVWPDNAPIGTHSKLVVVDDAGFYLGSHNLYPANLQEFGLVVTDPAATRALKAQYWDKVWAASGPQAYACPL